MVVNKGGFFMDGFNAFSYQTCIMTRAENGKLILNVTYYSHTTTKHQMAAFGSFVNRGKGNKLEAVSANVIALDNVPKMASADDLRQLAEGK